MEARWTCTEYSVCHEIRVVFFICGAPRGMEDEVEDITYSVEPSKQ